MKQWVVSDIDGTLASSDHSLSSRTVEVILAAQQQGIGMVLASGRSPYSMQYYVDTLQLEQYEGIGICFNGAVVYDFKTHEVLSESYIPNDELLACLKVGKEMGLELAVYSKNKIYSEVQNDKLTSGYFAQKQFTREESSHSYHQVQYILVDDLLTLECDAHKIAAYIYDVNVWNDIIALGNPLGFMRVNAHWLERNPQETSKGKALLAFCETKQIEMENLLVFGDGENDQSMFEVAVHAIAMENAFPSLKALASAITLTNDENGVAEYISEHLLSKF